jgi:SNF family Na+-dependent transporter
MTLRGWFQLDGLGALVSGVLLGAVLPRFEAFFGMPAPVARMLAGIAFLFALWSLGHRRWHPAPGRLRAIAMANAAYCTLTAVLVAVYREPLTGWGFAYFLGEIALVLGLAGAELRAVARMR